MVLGGEPPVPSHDPDEVRRAVDDILSSREFRRPAPSLIERAQEEFSELLGRILESLVGTGGATVIAWLVLIGAVLLVLYFARRWVASVSPDRAVAREHIMVELTRTPAEWRALAEEEERAGRWKAGLRSRYRALVAEMVASDVLDDLPGRTGGEYRREVVERRPTAAADFGSATDLFERAWYGDEPTGPAERDRFVALDLSLSGSRS